MNLSSKNNVEKFEEKCVLQRTNPIVTLTLTLTAASGVRGLLLDIAGSLYEFKKSNLLKGFGFPN